jgi:RNA polymerase sigma-70 factor (ECF subfamily)
MSGNSTEVTRLLRNFDLADPGESELLLGLIYDELKRLASGQMRRERSGHTLQPTALVHEAFLRLADADQVSYAGRTHFFAVAARAMRQILIDHARRAGAVKRGGDWRRITFEDDITPDVDAEFDLIDLHEALEKLGELDPRLSQMVELRFFGGLTLDEAAAVLGVSRRKVAKDWSFARLWLAAELEGGG